MLRRLILTAVLSTTILTGFAVTTATAQFRPPIARHIHAASFEVLYRHGDHWHTQGTYRTRPEAERAAMQLRQRGYVVKIEQAQGW